MARLAVSSAIATTIWHGSLRKKVDETLTGMPYRGDIWVRSAPSKKDER
jgi:hypothetical protein